MRIEVGAGLIERRCCAIAVFALVHSQERSRPTIAGFRPRVEPRLLEQGDDSPAKQDLLLDNEHDGSAGTSRCISELVVSPSALRDLRPCVGALHRVLCRIADRRFYRRKT
jgi:hypothetical protein